MATYKVEKRDNGYYWVVGLRDDFDGGSDTMLLYRVPYPETEWPEVASPESAKRMLGALYDLYQCHDGLKKGDRFETPHGDFECVGVHVVPADDKGRHR